MRAQQYNERIVEIVVRLFASAFYHTEAIFVSVTKKKCERIHVRVGKHVRHGTVQRHGPNAYDDVALLHARVLTRAPGLHTLHQKTEASASERPVRSVKMKQDKCKKWERRTHVQSNSLLTRILEGMKPRPNGVTFTVKSTAPEGRARPLEILAFVLPTSWFISTSPTFSYSSSTSPTPATPADAASSLLGSPDDWERDNLARLPP
jgi:hypothetical protein